MQIHAHSIGQKTSPILLRLGLNQTWNSVWYKGNKHSYSSLLHKDFLTRNYLAAVYSKLGFGQQETEHGGLIRPFGEALASTYTERGISPRKVLVASPRGYVSPRGSEVRDTRPSVAGEGAGTEKSNVDARTWTYIGIYWYRNQMNLKLLLVSIRNLHEIKHRISKINTLLRCLEVIMSRPTQLKVSPQGPGSQLKVRISKADTRLEQEFSLAPPPALQGAGNFAANARSNCLRKNLISRRQSVDPAGTCQSRAFGKERAAYVQQGLVGYQGDWHSICVQIRALINRIHSSKRKQGLNCILHQKNFFYIKTKQKSWLRQFTLRNISTDPAKHSVSTQPIRHSVRTTGSELLQQIFQRFSSSAFKPDFEKACKVSPAPRQSRGAELGMSTSGQSPAESRDTRGELYPSEDMAEKNQRQKYVDLIHVKFIGLQMWKFFAYIPTSQQEPQNVSTSQPCRNMPAPGKAGGWDISQPSSASASASASAVEGGIPEATSVRGYVSARVHSRPFLHKTLKTYKSAYHRYLWRVIIRSLSNPLYLVLDRIGSSLLLPIPAKQASTVPSTDGPLRRAQSFGGLKGISPQAWRSSVPKTSQVDSSVKEHLTKQSSQQWGQGQSPLAIQWQGFSNTPKALCLYENLNLIFSTSSQNFQSEISQAIHSLQGFGGIHHVPSIRRIFLASNGLNSLLVPEGLPAPAKQGRGLSPRPGGGDIRSRSKPTYPLPNLKTDELDPEDLCLPETKVRSLSTLGVSGSSDFADRSHRLNSGNLTVNLLNLIWLYLKKYQGFTSLLGFAFQLRQNSYGLSGKDLQLLFAQRGHFFSNKRQGPFSWYLSKAAGSDGTSSLSSRQSLDKNILEKLRWPSFADVTMAHSISTFPHQALHVSSLSQSMPAHALVEASSRLHTVESARYAQDKVQKVLRENLKESSQNIVVSDFRKLFYMFRSLGYNSLDSNFFSLPYNDLPMSLHPMRRVGISTPEDLVASDIHGGVDTLDETKSPRGDQAGSKLELSSSQVFKATFEHPNVPWISALHQTQAFALIKSKADFNTLHTRVSSKQTPSQKPHSDTSLSYENPETSSSQSPSKPNLGARAETLLPSPKLGQCVINATTLGMQENLDFELYLGTLQPKKDLNWQTNLIFLQTKTLSFSLPQGTASFPNGRGTAAGRYPQSTSRISQSGPPLTLPGAVTSTRVSPPTAKLGAGRSPQGLGTSWTSPRGDVSQRGFIPSGRYRAPVSLDVLYNIRQRQSSGQYFPKGNPQTHIESLHVPSSTSTRGSVSREAGIHAGIYPDNKFFLRQEFTRQKANTSIYNLFEKQGIFLSPKEHAFALFAGISSNSLSGTFLPRSSFAHIWSKNSSWHLNAHSRNSWYPPYFSPQLFPMSRSNPVASLPLPQLGLGQTTPRLVRRVSSLRQGTIPAGTGPFTYKVNIIIKQQYSKAQSASLFVQNLSRFVIAFLKKNKGGKNKLQQLKNIAYKVLSSLTINHQCLGVGLRFSGRVYGARKASSLKLLFGSVPFNTFQANLDYSQIMQKTRNGTWGFQTWLHLKQEKHDPRKNSKYIGTSCL